MNLNDIFRYLVISGTLIAGTVNATTVPAVAPKMPMSTASTKLKGVNLSGAEYSSNNIAAKPGYQYTYPSNAEIDYYKNKGFTVIRLPFSGSRLQPVAMGELNKNELTLLRATVNYAASKGMYVILDPHEYGARYDAATKTKKYFGIKGGVPASQFGNFWKRVATEFKTYPNVVFGLMNEPNKQTPKEWRAVAEYGVYGIRKAGAKQLILIPGTAWTGAHNWVQSGNAAAWTGFKDANFAFEMHQYLDSDYSGTHSTCVAGKGNMVLQAATDWARANHYKVFIGETGWSSNSVCLTEGANLMNYMSKNDDVWNGWAYWSAGRWIAQSYMYMLTPANLSTPIDKPQMQALATNL